MTPEDFQAELDKEKADRKDQDDKQATIGAINKAGIKNVQATNANTSSTAEGLKDVRGKVEVTNNDLAKSDDVHDAVDAIHKLNLTTFNTNQGLPQLTDNLIKLAQVVETLQKDYENKGVAGLSKQLVTLLDKLKDVSQILKDSKVGVDSGLQKTVNGLQKSIDAIDFKPTVNVSAPDTKVVTTPVDLSSVNKALAKVEKAISSQETPPEVDLSPIISGLQDVQEAISSQRFPVPNYVLPFKDSNGKAIQVQLDASGNVPTSGGGSGGGGTQYTDGAAAATHPIGTQEVFTNGSGIVTAVSTANPLPITGTISIGNTTDESAFTAGTSTTGPIAGVFNDSVATLSSGQQGTIRATTNRGLHTNLRNASGIEIATNSNPVRTDPTGTTTQPVSATSLPLPTGASTAAKQPAIGTAGTPSADVLSVQGETGMTALKVDGSAVTQPVSATSLPLPTGAATSANQATEISSLSTIATNTTGVSTAANQTNGTQQTKITDGTNIVAVNVVSGKNGAYVSSNSASGSAVPTNAFYIAGGDGTNLQGIRMSKGDAGSAVGVLGMIPALSNGTTFDSQRANTTGAVIAAGTTSTQTGIALTTYNAKKLVLVINISAGAGTLTVAINGTTASAYSYNILTSTALTGVATNELRVFPGATPASNLVANDVVPRNLSITATVVGTITYGIDYILAV